jgi:hypothetical protein
MYLICIVLVDSSWSCIFLTFVLGTRRRHRLVHIRLLLPDSYIEMEKEGSFFALGILGTKVGL